MTNPTRRSLLSGAATSLVSSRLPSRGAQRGPVGADGIDGYGPYDDDRLYRDEAGQLYRRRDGRYVPYGERSGAAAPDRGPGR